MQYREPTDIADLIAEAQKNEDEIKQLQLFGGDALNLKKFEQVLTMPGGITKDYCWRITMTPTEPGFTIPIDTTTKPAVANQFGYLKVERVPKTDGTFEWLAFGSQFDFDPVINTMFRVIYSGAAEFQVTQIA